MIFTPCEKYAALLGSHSGIRVSGIDACERGEARAAWENTIYDDSIMVMFETSIAALKAQWTWKCFICISR
jgi:hypothetical protein